MNSVRLKSGASAVVFAIAVMSLLGLSACGAKQSTVPNLTGLTQSEANASLSQAGLSAGSVTEQFSDDTSAGAVLSQNPAPGTLMDARSAVAYVVSKGKEPPPQATVPDVSGLDEKAAAAAIEGAGLAMVPYDEYDSDAAKGKAFGQVPGASQRADQGATVFVGFSLGAEPTDEEVPNVVGRTQSSAVARLEKGGFKTSVKSASVVGAKKGQVVAQSPRSGEDAGPGSHVIILVASASPTAKVPATSGKRQHAAATALSNAGFVPVVYHSVSADVPRGQVMGQLPAAGKQELSGAEVAIVISGGKVSSGTSPTPDVVGLSKSRAQSAIRAAGFRAQVVEAYDASVPKGSVIGQVPGAGKKVDPGQDVVISVSLGSISRVGIAVPKVGGKSQASAESAIRKAGLRTQVSRLYSQSVAQGKVMGQLPKAGARLMRNAHATIVMSLGKHAPLDVAVPNVTGKTKAEALAVLRAAEFDPIETLVFTEAAGSGTIYEQYPKAGEKVKQGSRVVIVAAQ